MLLTVGMLMGEDSGWPVLAAQWDNLVPRFPAAIAELWEDFLELGMPTPGDRTQPVPRNASWVSMVSLSM